MLSKADGTSTVESIFFTSLNPTKDMSSTKWEYGNTYSEFNPNLKIYVKKTALTHYKDEDHEHAGWERYASQISYKIPYIGAAGAPAIAKSMVRSHANSMQTLVSIIQKMALAK